MLCLQLVEYRFILQRNLLIVPGEFDSVGTWFVVQFQRRMLFAWCMEFAQNSFGLSRQAFAFWLEWASLVGSALALLHVAKTRLTAAWMRYGAIVLLLFVYTLAGVLSKNHAFLYIFDTPSLLVHCLGLAAVSAGAWRWLIALVFIGTFNRETTLWLVLAYILATQPPKIGVSSVLQGMKRHGFVYAALLACWAVPKLALNAWWPGSLTGNQLSYNAHFILGAIAHGKLLRLSALGAASGFLPLYLVWNIRIIAGFKGFWRCSWVLFPIFLFLPLTSVLIEARVYIDILPYMILPSLFVYQNTQLQMNGAGLSLQAQPEEASQHFLYQGESDRVA